MSRTSEGPPDPGGDYAGLDQCKRTSVLRRVRLSGNERCVAEPGREGDVCAFELIQPAVAVEHPNGRAMMLAPGDIFLGTPGNRESTRWVVGAVPEQGLVPGEIYWIIAGCGMVGRLIASSPLPKTHLAEARFMGVIATPEDGTLRMRDFAIPADTGQRDRTVPVFLIVGTAAEVGKTTAGIAVLTALRRKGHASVGVLKATGTTSIVELQAYEDFGATRTFDAVDFGLPSTYPSNRTDIEIFFRRVVTSCLSLPLNALLIECGGDLLGANVPTFIRCLLAEQADVKTILVAADALAAYGGTSVLQGFGITPILVTGPCTDTPTLLDRTQEICGIPAVSLLKQAPGEKGFLG